MGRRGWVAVGVVALLLVGGGVGAKVWRDGVRAANEELERLVAQANRWDAAVDECLRRGPDGMAMSPPQCREVLGAELDAMRRRGFDGAQVDGMRAKLGRAADVAELGWLAAEAPRGAAIDEAGRRALASDRAGAQHALDRIGRGSLLIETLAPESDHETHRAAAMVAARDLADKAAWARIALPDRRGTAGPNDDWYLLRGASLCLLGERARGRSALAEGERQRSSGAPASPHLDLAWRACADEPPKTPLARGKSVPDREWARTAMAAAALADEPTRPPGRASREHLQARLAVGPGAEWKEPWPLAVAAHALATGATRDEVLEAARSRGPRRPFPCHGEAAPPSGEPAEPRALAVDGALDVTDPEDLLYTTAHGGYDAPPPPIAPEVLERAAAEVTRRGGGLSPEVQLLAEDLAILAARRRLARGEGELARKAAEGAPTLVAAGVSLAAGDAAGARALAERALAAGPTRRAAVDAHLVLARALADLGQWAPALTEARATEAALAACWPPRTAKVVPLELRVRALWLHAAIAVHVGEPPPPGLARYQPEDPDAGARLPPGASEELVLDAWRAALGDEVARRDARRRWLRGKSGEASGPELYVLSRLADPADAETWLDAAEAARLGDVTGSVRRGGRLRAARRATAARWRSDATAATTWTDRQRLLSELARGPRPASAELLAQYVGL